MLRYLETNKILYFVAGNIIQHIMFYFNIPQSLQEQQRETYSEKS